jgi:hypothetical protein
MTQQRDDKQERLLSALRAIASMGFIVASLTLAGAVVEGPATATPCEPGSSGPQGGETDGGHHKMSLPPEPPPPAPCGNKGPGEPSVPQLPPEQRQR